MTPPRLAARLAACSAERPPVVVGNGSGLIGLGLGPVVDASPLVVRCNGWTVARERFAADYGTACHLHVVGASWATPAEGAEVWRVHSGHTLPRREERTLAPWPTAVAKGSPKCSTGLLAVHQLTLWVPLVLVGGFDHCAGGYRDYWWPEGTVAPVGDVHDYEFEARLFREWERQGRVRRLENG